MIGCCKYIKEISNQVNLVILTIIQQQIRAFSRDACKLLLVSYLMDQDLNNLNQLLVDNDSFHFPGPTQEMTIRKSSMEIKHLQQQISPANIPLLNKTFLLQSPSPFRHHPNFYEEDQSYSQDNPQNFSIQPRRTGFNTKLNFDESPRKKSSTAGSQKIINKIPQPNIFSTSNKDEKKNSKGLRNLSESVFKIVLELNVTTYKEVADHLVRKLNAGQFGPLQQGSSKSKDQQNIKRRVYDALNVLISADVLKKNGKYVLSCQQDSNSQKSKLPSRNNKKQDKDNLYEQIRKKQEIIKQKRMRIQQIKNKKQILNAVMKRNRKKKILEKQKIMFPLIAVTFQKSIPKLIRNQSHSKIMIPLQNLTEVIADMDLLLKAGIDVLSQNIDQIIEQVSEEDLEPDQPAKKKAKTDSNNNCQSKQKVAKVLYSL